MTHPTLSPPVFALAAERARMRAGGRSYDAARLYLVDGLTMQQAGILAGGITKQAVYDAVSRVRVAADLDQHQRRPLTPLMGREI